MNREQLFYNLMNTVSPVTQRVLEDWIASLSTFADVLNRYPPLVANDVLMELEFYSVIVWKDGIPRLVFLKQ